MNRFHRATLLAAATALATACMGPRDGAAVAVQPASPPEAALGTNLLEGLGNHHFPVTSSHPEVQRWFDQGLMLSYGFNHDAAERAFLKATQLDPQCAMCWWGAALVVGPHVNAGMDPKNNASAWSRLQKARELAPKASAREQAFIEALSARYAANPPENRRPLDEAYAVATRELMRKLPDDLDAATFHAEALMDLQPWDYYDDNKQPKGHTSEIVSTLESVMKRNPDHPGALHLYVHAVEASADPQRGVDAADREIHEYPSVGHFFIRDLREGLRPIEGNFVSPVDGVLRNYGVIADGRLEQIKGKTYTVARFLGDEGHARRYEQGAFFNLYLSPQDYHHVHSPVGGKGCS